MWKYINFQISLNPSLIILNKTYLQKDKKKRFLGKKPSWNSNIFSYLFSKFFFKVTHFFLTIMKFFILPTQLVDNVILVYLKSY